MRTAGKKQVAAADAAALDEVSASGRELSGRELSASELQPAKAARSGKTAAKAAPPKAAAGRPSTALDKKPAKAAAKSQASAPARVSRRPRNRDTEDETDGGGRLFVTALARGLDVLSAFGPRDGALGNQELADRTGLPKPTVSRITYTLMQLGYLTYNPRLANYALGGRTLSLGYAALSNLDVRRVARPFMQKLADEGNFNISLGMRDRLMILNIETCESEALVGLRLPPGSRMPIAITSTGKAYLAAAPKAEREAVLAEVKATFSGDFSRVERSVERAMRDIAEKGFCISVGEWQKDVNGAGAPIVMPGGRGIYALGVGGPAYLMSEQLLNDELGPMLADAAREIAALLGGTVA